MKVQHPIQHMVASFWAFMPKENSLRVERSGLGDYICGEYDGRRQVFGDYYRAVAAKRTQDAPHIRFARSRDSEEEICQFTAEWGPLCPNHSPKGLLQTAFGPTSDPAVQFAFLMNDWRISRTQFAEANQFLETDDIKALRPLLPYQHQSQNPLRTGALYPYFDIGTPIEKLQRIWNARRSLEVSVCHEG